MLGKLNNIMNTFLKMATKDSTSKLGKKLYQVVVKYANTIQKIRFVVKANPIIRISFFVKSEKSNQFRSKLTKKSIIAIPNKFRTESNRISIIINLLTNSFLLSFINLGVVKRVNVKINTKGITQIKL